jgi:hypothetical protein
MKKGKPSASRIRCSKKIPKNFRETWAQRIYGPKNLPSMAAVQPYCKSVWGEKAQHNETAEWIGEEKSETTDPSHA